MRVALDSVCCVNIVSCVELCESCLGCVSFEFCKLYELFSFVLSIDAIAVILSVCCDIVALQRGMG